MERLLIKDFLKYLEDDEVVNYCEKLSELIEGDFQSIFIEVKSKTDGLENTVPNIKCYYQCIRDVIASLISFMNSIETLCYHGKTENRRIKDALALNDYAPFKKFALDITAFVKFVRTCCNKFVFECENANKIANIVIESYIKVSRKNETAGWAGAVVAGGVMGGTLGVLTMGLALPLLAGAGLGVAVSVGFGLQERKIKELKELLKSMSVIIQSLISHALQLCKKLELYSDDIDFCLTEIEPMQRSLSSEDRTHIFITLDSIYHACRNLHERTVKWISKMSEIKNNL